MKWIDSTDLRAWSNRRDCQDTLPLLARKLIRATSNSIKSIKFPSGDSVLIGGWDGILEVIDGTEYLPSGKSLWEFGAGKDPKGKADDDYLKRTKNPLGFDPKESTFVFVTPRLWQYGKEWAEEKMKEGNWKDIRVYNSEVLEEWIDEAPTVGSWLATRYLGKYPSGGIQATTDYWDEWTTGPNMQLIPDLLLGGRRSQCEKLVSLIKDPSIIPLQGVSRDEALAYIISCFKDNPLIEEDFFSRSIIVNNTEAFRKLLIINKPLILIPRFEDEGGIINRAAKMGHTVILPLGADSSGEWFGNIKLPQIDRDSFISSLIKIGLKKDTAEKLSKESARNITILRRRLEFTRATPIWAMPENASEIIPALIVGRWDESSESDKKIVEQISGESYENYSKKLMRWLYSPDPPVVKIGTMYRLTSPLDSWTHVSKRLTRNDFELLHLSAIQILSEIDPALKLPPEKRPFASMQGKHPVFSNWIGEGIIQSLILTSIFGEKLQFDLPHKPDIWVDNIVRELLENTDSLWWKTNHYRLPLIAEASPIAFLSSVEKHLEKKKSTITELFEEDPGFFMPQSYYTGLLWALEGMAWFPEHIAQSSLILTRLANIDPGGHLSNRPINSLKEIFKPWHCQTLATLEERIKVLKLIAERHIEIAWTVLIGMLPHSMSDVGFPTAKTRWRMFEQNTDISISYPEMFETYSAVLELLLSIYDNTEPKLAKLIEESVNLTPSDRNKLLSFIESVLHKVDHSTHACWEKTKLILSHHRSYPDAEWALSEPDLLRYEKLHDALQPSDEIARSASLFNDHWPRLLIGYNHKKESHEERQEKIDSLRVSALKGIYTHYGIDKIISLSATVKEEWSLGDSAARIIENEEEILLICEQLKNNRDKLRFVFAFIIRKSIINGMEWVFVLFEKLVKKGFPSNASANLLMPIQQGAKLWNFIDVIDKNERNEYWLNMTPHFYNVTEGEKIRGLKSLIEYKRFYSAIDICAHFATEIPTDLIVTILLSAATKSASEPINIKGYQVGQLFGAIDKNGGISEQQLINIEWLYLPVLDSYGTSRSPKLLHETLAKDPEFFITVLKWAYKPDNEELLESEQKELPEEVIANRGIQAYQLFQSWKKIPGVEDSGEINAEGLNGWIDKVRDLASKVFRLEVADMTIGKLLAQYPSRNERWPPDEICMVLEKINTDIIKSEFSSAVFNIYGSSTRGPFDGGDIEREKAKYFQTLAAAKKNTFPAVSAIFENLSKWYMGDAKRMDERAERDRLDF